MNIKFLVFASLLIALLSHVLFFNLFTFVFQDTPEEPKPKFFFLGPILSHSDVAQVTDREKLDQGQEKSMEDNPSPTTLRDLISESKQSAVSPYADRNVDKPSTQNVVDESTEKTAIKSTFEIELDTASKTPSELSEREDIKLDIAPYKPITVRTP